MGFLPACRARSRIYTRSYSASGRRSQGRHPEPFVKKITLNIVWIASTQADINVAVVADALPASTAGPVAFYTGTNLLNLDGTPTEPSWTCSRRTRRRSGPSRAATHAWNGAALNE